MSPALLWMEHVMGFERFWEIQFHTQDVAGEREGGSGLKSVVMWDKPSGVKFANNEPKRPHFQRLADQPLPRGPARRRHPARGAGA